MSIWNGYERRNIAYAFNINNSWSLRTRTRLFFIGTAQSAIHFILDRHINSNTNSKWGEQLFVHIIPSLSMAGYVCTADKLQQSGLNETAQATNGCKTIPIVVFSLGSATFYHHTTVSHLTEDTSPHYCVQPDGRHFTALLCPIWRRTLHRTTVSNLTEDTSPQYLVVSTHKRIDICLQRKTVQKRCVLATTIPWRHGQV